jgi:putative OPT family oligopeptide transporter
MQDLKIGHILGGTPARMQIAEFVGVAAAAVSIPIAIIALHESDIMLGGTGLGGMSLPAPQAGLMGMLTTGILGGEMTWILVIIGMFIGLVFILLGVASPMIVSVGMYLPFCTTFGIFLGGIVRHMADRVIGKKTQKKELREGAINRGILVAGGFIAGEGLMGVSLAIIRFCGVKIPRLATALIWPGFLVILLVAFLMIYFPWKYVAKERI